jgi:hypothetical protein
MKINAYPNPTADLITVSAINNNYQKVSLAITDVSGRSIGQYNTLAAGSIQLTSGTPIAGYPVQTDGTGHLSFTPPPTGACTVCVWAYATDGTDIYNTNPGYVGIGTSTPQSDITIWGADIVGGNQPNAVAEVDNNQSSYIDNTGHSDDIIHTANYAPNSLIVNRVNTIGQTYPSPPTSTTVTDFVVTSSGYVGIGTATPQSTLDVAGGVAVGTYAGSASAPSNGMIVSGYVGIGTNDPAFNLDVNGNARVSTILNVGTDVGQINITSPGLGAGSSAIYMLVSDPTVKAIHVQQQNQSGGTPYPYTDKFVVYANGQTVIGGQQPQTATYNNFALAVNGNIVAKQVLVETSDWADKVFDRSYPLMPLTEVEKYLAANKHLPEMPTECEAIDKGVNLGEMNKLLLQKIEELTLYMIDQQKEIEALKAKK